ncbi:MULTISPECIES: flagellar hook-length control protein FliK [unclassified Rhodanobacter]|uniref:flagellar hook-length control protein FliK n=1 Tax=unclassified Rhodanobacter TaxID=2621553 RepID=UPI001BDFE397|nr:MULTISPECIES: flagellar hook-length control protein FliK [unclassified Rhodanobacter]MBT2145238.1 flagellar hook-length control protein FliK [Rhodanobacter sp. LX-99]MBT2149283.1 flagellar hook-length control protein FliK [Rhodanobacter sp. LX-100]
MTASVPVTASSAAATAGSRPAAAAEPRDGAGTAAGFGSQLHAARQQRDAESTNGAPNDQDGRKHLPAAPPPLDPPADSTIPANPAAVPAPPPAAVATAQAAEAIVPTTGEPAAKADKSEPDDQPASAMAGAMLVLLGSSVAGLPPVAGGAGAVAGALAQAGKTVASDARAAAVLQLGATGSPAAAPANTVPVAASMLAMAHAALPASTAADKDSSERRGLAALSAPPAAAAPVAVHQLQLPSPLGSQSFAQDLGQQVAWLGGQDIKQARIRLHPEELGSLDVNVSVTQGRVDVVFSAQHPAAVSAVQQSLPQLDQMLARHGLSLGHTEVGQHGRGDRRGHAGDGGTTAVDEIGDVHGGSPVSLGKVGLLDAFA